MENPEYIAILYYFINIYNIMGKQIHYRYTDFFCKKLRKLSLNFNIPKVLFIY